ncbi:MAG: PEP-CTERM sorting domain-containing protein [Edaphobacter sp.]|uniref:PEP-CTERM sorting domain-containing protein n=1 Tax=Edaphobacter sp. TaxID=1934404 RepID=UPI002388B4A4|nr:PEP-CTERM sorting domain-containing protein [Edaphobacter sp.]MDE1177389.1 PEP-CTERM sorting domain-containing protein [Edaphobacter sp.]
MKTAIAKVALRSAGILSALTLAAATVAHADPMIVNGGFEQTLTPTSSQFGSQYPSQQVTGWNSTGYNFVFLPGTANTTGAVGTDNPVIFWGPANGSNNGFTASPDGGNFVAIDGVYQPGPLTQVVTGLTPGSPVTISFYYAGAQQYGFDGDTTDAIQISLGSETYTTDVLSVDNHGFTGWQAASFTFTPTSTSELLSFMADSTPAGDPPFALLDGVTITSPVPEPGSLVLLSTGLLSAAGYVGRRYRKLKG